MFAAEPQTAVVGGRQITQTSEQPKVLKEQAPAASPQTKAASQTDDHRRQQMEHICMCPITQANYFQLPFPNKHKG